VNVADVDRWGPTLTSDELVAVVRKAIKNVSHYCRIYYSDDEYYCPNEAVAKSLMTDPKMKRLK